MKKYEIWIRRRRSKKKEDKVDNEHREGIEMKKDRRTKK